MAHLKSDKKSNACDIHGKKIENDGWIWVEDEGFGFSGERFDFSRENWTD